MKLLIQICSICLCLNMVSSEDDIGKDTQSKSSIGDQNLISSQTQKLVPEYTYQNYPKYRYQHIYQPTPVAQQQQSGFQYVVPVTQQYESTRKVLVPVQRTSAPTAMIIIAQPAIVPANMLYGNIAQQLLHYFQNNPQARNQLIQNALTHQPQFIQPVQVPQVNHASYQQLSSVPIATGHSQRHYATPTSNLATPLANVASPTQNVYQTAPTAPQYTATQHAAPQYSTQYTQNYQQPLKTAPAIITGFENFTPEQQEKIKAQLSQHFGPLQPLNVGKTKAVRLSYAGPQNNYFPSNIKYEAPQNSLNSEEFVPSQQIGESSVSSEEKDQKSEQYGTKM